MSNPKMVLLHSCFFSAILSDMYALKDVQLSFYLRTHTQQQVLVENSVKRTGMTSVPFALASEGMLNHATRAIHLSIEPAAVGPAWI